MKRLLAVIDMQNDFIDGALGTKEALNIVENVRRRIMAAQKAGEAIAYTRDTHEADYLATQEGKNLPVPHCIRGSLGWQIAADIPVLGEIFDKPAFGSVALAETVRSVGYDAVELIGLCTDICVISNAMLIKAFGLETYGTGRESCCAGVTPERHKNAFEAVRVGQIAAI